MESKTFSPIIFSKTPVVNPKIIKQGYSLDKFTDTNSVEEEKDNDEQYQDDYEDDDDDYEDDYDYDEKPPVLINKLFSSSPIVNRSSSSSNYDSTNYMNKMTLDLMMNPHYLAKANPSAFQKKVEQAQHILKYRREIYKTMNDCFDALENLVNGNENDNIDLDVQTGFMHFAKSTMFNIQRFSGKSDTEPIFSVCNDIHSSFYPYKNP